MVPTLLVATALMAAAPPETASPSTEGLLGYQAARSQAGRDPDAHVRLALWCEGHGMVAERLRHLTLALLADPEHAAARGLMGLVAYRGQWRKPGDVAQRVKADAESAAARAEYEARRADAANTPDAQWKLALWCEEKGLQAEAFAHLAAVVRLDPNREEAWKRLGYKRHNNRWMTDAQVVAAKADAEAQKQADRRWKPLLEKWKGWLADERRRAEAESALAGVTDPRAVPSVCRVFGVGGANGQVRAAQVLGQIDAPTASRALAALAVTGRSAEVRRVATEILTRRDVREFAGPLVMLLRDPIKYELRPVGGPGSAGELFIEGERANIKRLYAPPAAPEVPPMLGDRVALDAAGRPVIHRPTGPIFQVTLPQIQTLSRIPFTDPWYDRPLIDMLTNNWSMGYANPHWDLINEAQRATVQFEQARTSGSFRRRARLILYLQDQIHIPVGQMATEAQTSALVAQEQLRGDIDAIERYNAPIHQSNDRVQIVLSAVAGQNLGVESKVWKAWWLEQVGYAYLPQRYTDKPTIVENVPLAYEPKSIPLTQSPALSMTIAFGSCFGAGTPVHTLSGTLPIESLEVGDQVLTQDTATGGLSYQPILIVHRNPPSKTYKIVLSGETIVSSPFHRFWLAGRGWKMARDLAVGDTVRTLGGLVDVSAKEEGEVQPVFNLDVAETASFFVGRGGALVHDNTLPSPSLEPFDARPALATADAR